MMIHVSRTSVPFLVLILLTSACSPGSEEGETAKAGPAANAGDQVWKFETGGQIWSTPILGGGRIFFGSDDGNFYAVDPATGDAIWQFSTDGPVRSRCAVCDDRVVFASDDGLLYALDAASGKVSWKLDTESGTTPRRLPAPDSPYDYDYMASSPVCSEGNVYVGSAAGRLFALDLETGEPVWEYVHEDGSWVESSAVYADGTLYVGSSDALALQALNPADGAELWRYKTGGWSWSTPVVDGDTVYIGAISAYPYYFEGVNLERGLHAVDRDTGTLIWRFETGPLTGGYLTGGVFTSPALTDDAVYVGALDGNLYALKR